MQQSQAIAAKEQAGNTSDLLGMLAEMAGDIIIKTDANGFIDSASSGLDTIGLDLSQMLINPHLADLAKHSHSLVVRDYHRHAVSSVSPAETITFPVAVNDHTNEASDNWYSLSLRPAPTGSGALGVMRSVRQKRELEQRLRCVTQTDQLTGLPNRQAFKMVLSDALVTGQSGAVALIEVDHFRAITLRFGPSMGDEVITAFAQFLTAFGRPEHMIARMDAERFAVFLPACELGHAIAWTQDIIETFARISAEQPFEKTQLTASAGVARLSGSIDSALSRAELGVSVAKASGGTRTECGDWLHGCENAETVRSRRSLCGMV